MKRIVPYVVCCALAMLAACKPASTSSPKGGASSVGPTPAGSPSGSGTPVTIGKPGNLYPLRKGGKFGFIDSTGKMAIEPKFVSASRFTEDLAMVVVDDPKTKAKNARKKVGYIDKEGKMVIEPKFDGGAPFSDGYATVWTGPKAGLINKKGDVVIDPKFDRISRFHDGLAAAVITRDARGLKARDGGYINDKGKFVIHPQFDPNLTPFSEGVAGVKKMGQLWGFIDKDQKAVVAPRYFMVGQFSEGVAGAMDAASRWGFVDKTGKWVIDPKFQYVQFFSEGLCGIVSAGGKKLGYINRKGTITIKEQFDIGEPFVDGIAMVQMGDKAGYINKEGKFVVPLE